MCIRRGTRDSILRKSSFIAVSRMRTRPECKPGCSPDRPKPLAEEAGTSRPSTMCPRTQQSSLPSLLPCTEPACQFRRAHCRTHAAIEHRRSKPAFDNADLEKDDVHQPVIETGAIAWEAIMLPLHH